MGRESGNVWKENCWEVFNTDERHQVRPQEIL